MDFRAKRHSLPPDCRFNFYAFRYASAVAVFITVTPGISVIFALLLCESTARHSTSFALMTSSLQVYCEAVQSQPLPNILLRVAFSAVILTFVKVSCEER